MRLRDIASGVERDVSGDEPSAGATAVRSGDVVWVAFRGAAYRITNVLPRARGAGETPSLEAPMPGRILAVRTRAGAHVAKGEILVVLEAMKMEHAVKAPRAGIVDSVPVSEGQMVSFGQILAVLR